jgi:hypothetical protein
MNKAFLFIVCIVLFGSIAVGRFIFAPPPANGEPLPVTINVTPAHLLSTATPAPTPTLAPVTGEPVRVRFDLDSYGDTITGTVSTAYLLWARAGQAFTTTLTSGSTATASLYTPDGVALYQELAAGYTAKATLPTNGDYRLEIRSSGNYTAGVMIR